ncbi:MAG: MarR family transcriptional regulator [Sphingomonas sp. SCN 67-18]|uniref:MarR family winged helix-turn-helix transcriptional regulator n=1 Tax=uncultured Sphingomonas sp. TaxID=158754 RepID=UPI00086B1DC8|nr:MarR family transcriptional regulator [Sphingomonas sp. SCN 67-18]ODU22955.1 MAG: MarR family transcriptional regulator [Sphingomonas sp. SCN 67-18]
MATKHVQDDVQLNVLDGLVGYHLRRASTVFLHHFSQTVGELGLRQVLFGILSLIHDNPGIKQSAIGRVLGIQRANMVSLVGELTEGGLIARAVSAEDRRAFALSLTDKGRALVEAGLARIREHEDALLHNFSDRERASLIRLLTKIDAD